MRRFVPSTTGRKRLGTIAYIEPAADKQIGALFDGYRPVTGGSLHAGSGSLPPRRRGKQSKPMNKSGVDSGSMPLF